MTGYGKSVAEYEGKRITAEIRSLNSKALDLSTRVAPIYREREMEIRAMVSRRLERGKVDFSLWVEQDEAAEAAHVTGKFNHGRLHAEANTQIRHLVDAGVFDRG